MNRAALLGPVLIGFLAMAWTSGCGRSGSSRNLAPDAGADDAREPDLPPAVDETPFGPIPDDASSGGAGDETQPTVKIPTTPTACAITASLVPSRADAGPQALPPTHAFSLLIDWTGNTATAGSGGTATRVALVQKDGVWTTQGVLLLSLSLSLGGSSASGRPYFSYQQIAIRPTANGCAGQATGEYLWNETDMLFTNPFQAELLGVADQTGPTLSLLPAATVNVHPLDVFGVTSSELLPAGTSARWLATDGTPIPLSSLPTDATLGVSGFLQGEFALAFATSYQLAVLPAAVDLIGNLSTDLPSLATMAGPGFLQQDGFEGTVDALLGGKVALADATSLAIPAGNKAIRFAPTSVFPRGDWSCDDRFTARLVVAAGAKSVKLTVLQYWPATSVSRSPFQAWLRLAVPNGAVVDFSQWWYPKDGTPLPSPWTATPPGSDQWTYGALSQVELGLPPGTGNEIIFDLFRPCSTASPNCGGLVIDELQVE